MFWYSSKLEKRHKSILVSFPKFTNGLIKYDSLNVYLSIATPEISKIKILR